MSDGSDGTFVAYGIKLGNRWFHAFTKGYKLVQTAWSLAGAKLFVDNDDPRFLDVVRRLIAKGKYPVVVSVTTSHRPSRHRHHCQR